MKAFTRMLLLMTVVLFSACNDEGDDYYSYDLLGTVFETTGTFSSSNDYTLYFEFPSSFEVYDGDVVMVYILWEQTSSGDDVWRPLPQSVFLTDGSFQYNFDYTLYDVQIYVEANFDRSELASADLQNQTFRIAVIPADLYKSGTVDIRDYNAVMKASRLSSDKLTLKTVS